MFVAVAVLALAAIVIAAPDSAISCNVGNLDQHEAIKGFAACLATYDFSAGTTTLSGRHERTPAPKDDLSDTETPRKQECAIKAHRGSMQLRCTCFTSECNEPTAPMKLIEERFASL